MLFNTIGVRVSNYFLNNTYKLDMAMNYIFDNGIEKNSGWNLPHSNFPSYNANSI